MWQIYSKKTKGIRVRSTVGRLISGLRQSLGDKAHDKCFIGKVNYLKDHELKEFGRTVFANGVRPEAIARSLLVKRKAYKHENEVRIVCVRPSNRPKVAGVFKYTIDPRALVRQAMVDGRVSYKDYEALKQIVIQQTGLSANQVKRSLLYKPPEGFLVEVP